MDNRGDLDGTLYFFYDGPEVIEERDGSDDFYQHYVWGPNHIDELALIMGLNGTYFAYQDANWNVIGLTTPGGDLAEEYNYTPYGRQLAWRHTGHADGDADSDLDSADITAYSAAVWTVKGEDEEYDRDFDADYDGDVDGVDITAFSMAYSAAGDSLVVCNRAWSPNQNPYGFTNRRLDNESLLMHYRARTYNPMLKRFVQPDEWDYVDGPDLYQYVLGNPLRYADPWGSQAQGSGAPAAVAAAGAAVAKAKAAIAAVAAGTGTVAAASAAISAAAAALFVAFGPEFADDWERWAKQWLTQVAENIARSKPKPVDPGKEPKPPDGPRTGDPEPENPTPYPRHPDERAPRRTMPRDPMPGPNPPPPPPGGSGSCGTCGCIMPYGLVLSCFFVEAKRRSRRRGLG